MTLLAGADGSPKTFLMQSMALAVAAGDEFLGRRCQRTPVLYLDYENPGFAVQDRLALLTGFPDEPEALPNLKIWGCWLEHEPPQIGSDLLLQICRESKPLLIVDPLRYAHDREENDSGEMMMVMRHLRSYASAGATVLVVHHIAKTEGSTYRGSTALRGAFDVSYLQEQNDETGLLTLRCVKNRFGDKPVVYIRPDFEEGTFTVTDSPAWNKRQGDIERLRLIIAAEPGISVNQISVKSGIRKAACLGHLKDHNGQFWQSQPGPRKSVLYFPVTDSLVPGTTGNRGNCHPAGSSATGSVVPSLNKGTTRNQVAGPGTTGSASEVTKLRQATVCPVCRRLSMSHFSDGHKSCDNGCPAPA
jgi:hypothetical protein